MHAILLTGLTLGFGASPSPLLRNSKVGSASPVMLEKKLLQFDSKGEFQARELKVDVRVPALLDLPPESHARPLTPPQLPPVNLLRRIDELKVLTKVAEAGLLSQVGRR